VEEYLEGDDSPFIKGDKPFKLPKRATVNKIKLILHMILLKDPFLVQSHINRDVTRAIREGLRGHSLPRECMGYLSTPSNQTPALRLGNAYSTARYYGIIKYMEPEPDSMILDHKSYLMVLPHRNKILEIRKEVMATTPPSSTSLTLWVKEDTLLPPEEEEYHFIYQGEVTGDQVHSPEWLLVTSPQYPRDQFHVELKSPDAWEPITLPDKSQEAMVSFLETFGKQAKVKMNLTISSEDTRRLSILREME